MKVNVMVFASLKSYLDDHQPIRDYLMDHDDKTQRRVLGEQCRNAFEGGQVIVTFPVAN